MGGGCLAFLLQNSGYAQDFTFNFLKINDLMLNLGVYIDNLSIYMMLTVCIISLIVQIYSASYMFNNKSFPRFFAYLNLFNFSMLGLVLSPNLFQTYIFWELVGVSSYLLIGFDYKREKASNAAKKAFLMNRIGDTGFIIGIIILSIFMYQYSSTASLATVPFINIEDVANFLYSYTNDFVYAIICIFLLMGTIAKSAQFPLHTWLADAMEGPTPVSALIHSATMVAAGVYLIARLYPIFFQSEIVMMIIAIIGTITALLCAFIALSQNDFKRILAYSTSSQLGLMFMVIGLGAYSGAICHLVTHAYFKSLLFLISGIVIQSLSGLHDIRYMGGMRKFLPISAICYFIACISISGILFSGEVSKTLMVNQLFYSGHYVFMAIFLLASFITAFYMFRTYIMVFEGEKHNDLIPQKIPFTLNLSIILLTVLTVVVGYLLKYNLSVFDSYSVLLPQVLSEFPHLIAYCVIIFALVCVFAKSYLNYSFYIPKFLYNLSYNKFYIDEIYEYIANRVYSAVCSFCDFVDNYIIDGAVNLCVIVSRSFAWAFSKMQSGIFQSYIAYGILVIAILFAMLMCAYSLIINYGLVGG